MSTLVGAREANADECGRCGGAVRATTAAWRFHREVFPGLVPPPAGLTLAVGCGEGRVARDLAAIGHRVVALDAAPTVSPRTADR